MIGVMAFSTMILVMFIKPKKLFFLLRACSKAILVICGIKVVPINKQVLDPNKTYLFMGNHVNIFDHLVLISHLPVFVGIEKDSHFKWPIYGGLARRFGNIPVTQGGSKEDTQRTMDKALETMKNGISVCILPEGTRTKTGQIGSFKKGGFHFAIDTRSTIIPVTIKDSFAIKRKGNWLIKPGTVELVFSEPVDTTQYPKENLVDLLELVKSRIEAPLN